MRRGFRLTNSHRWWPMAASALVLALLLAQTLGLLHGIAHGVHGAGAPDIAAHAHDPTEPSHATHESNAPHVHVAGLFDTHEDESSECQLYDQLTHADLLWSAFARLTAAAPTTAHAQRAAQAPRVATAGWFLARAPPQRA